MLLVTEASWHDVSRCWRNGKVNIDFAYQIRDLSAPAAEI